LKTFLSILVQLFREFDLRLLIRCYTHWTVTFEEIRLLLALYVRTCVDVLIISLEVANEVVERKIIGLKFY